MRRSGRLLVSFAAVFPFLLPNADGLAKQTSSTGVTTCQVPAGRTRPPRGVSVKLKLPDRSVSAGEPVRMELSVRNRSPQRIEYSTGLPRWDYWVKGPGGVVWRWSRSLSGVWPDLLVLDELAPGRIKHRSKAWHQEDCSGSPVSFPPGRYVARALWSASVDTYNTGEKWWSNSVEFEIR